MVASCIEHRCRCEHLRNPLEPIRFILLVLIACAKGNISAVQNEVRLLLCSHYSKTITQVKELCIRYRHQVKPLRCRCECPKRALIESLLSDTDGITIHGSLRQRCQTYGIEPSLYLAVHALPLRRSRVA